LLNESGRAGRHRFAALVSDDIAALKLEFPEKEKLKLFHQKRALLL
jgi:hypothetical protein